ncbi:hypothetical protein F5Y16DRAFT_38671 [Xylariaceae sp. FL0255]|nr:hypothetical protein F5Y16DRAFT_38671 [Xylariaceae sp. FL0255]
MRRHILFMITDLETQFSLIRASAVFLAQYRSERDGIVFACLDRELNSFYVDAHAALHSSWSKFGLHRDKAEIASFLGVYNDSQQYPLLLTPMSSHSSSDIHWLAKFHRDVVRPLARMYSQWARKNLVRAATDRGWTNHRILPKEPKKSASFERCTGAKSTITSTAETRAIFLRI